MNKIIKVILTILIMPIIFFGILGVFNPNYFLYGTYYILSLLFLSIFSGVIYLIWTHDKKNKEEKVK